MTTGTDAPFFARSRWESRSTGPFLGAVIAMFVAIHLVRIGITPNNNGFDYLRNAVVLAHGHLARSHYSPGFGVLLAPVAWATGGRFHAMWLSAGLLNLALAAAALVLVHAYLRLHTNAWFAVGLTAVFALGETATVVLTGVEVEPLTLLLVAATLVLLNRDHAWLAGALTVLAVVCRVPVAPFFAVLWLFELRRRPVAAAATFGGIALAVGAHMATQSPLDASYISIASSAFRPRGGGHGILHRAIDIVPAQALGYLRLGIPSLLWPSAILTIPIVGAVLGLGTSAALALGAWRLLHDQVTTRAAVVGVVAQFVLLTGWPVTTPASIRMVAPFAPVVLLAAAAGLSALLTRQYRAPVWAGPAVLAAAALMAVTSSLAVTAINRDTPRTVRDLISINRRLAGRLPPGPVLAHTNALVQLLTGHASFDYPLADNLPDLEHRAQQVRACTLEVDPSYGRLLQPGLRHLADSGGGQLLGTAGLTTVIALNEPWCPPPAPS